MAGPAHESAFQERQREGRGKLTKRQNKGNGAKLQDHGKGLTQLIKEQQQQRHHSKVNRL